MLHAGITLGGLYRLETLIGKGGMGEVWLATHSLLKQPRAIKIMLGEIATNPRERDRFIEGEARNALQLEPHLNLVRVYELGLHENMPYIVMEYVKGSSQGATLRELLRNRGRLSLTETAFFLTRLASALEGAHRQNIIHRDLKPANILITAEGQPKLTDFGLTKSLEDEIDLTATGNSMGTPAYMSHEQAQGLAGRGSDIYSLGIIVYEMLTGRLPFQGTITSVLVQHATQTPAAPHQLASEISPQVDAVVLRALAKSPAERYATATQFAEAFEQALKARQTPIAHPVSNWPAPVVDERKLDVPVATPVPTQEGLEPFEEMIRGFFDRSKPANSHTEEGSPGLRVTPTPATDPAAQLANLTTQFGLANFQGDLERVIELGEEVLRRVANHQPTRLLTACAYRSRGAGLYERGYYKWAITDFNRAIQLEPQEAEFYFWRAKSYYQQCSASTAENNKAAYNQRNIEQAVADCSGAIMRSPAIAQYYYFRSHLYAALNQPDAAQFDLIKATDLGHTLAKKELAQSRSLWRKIF